MPHTIIRERAADGSEAIEMLRAFNDVVDALRQGGKPVVDGEMQKVAEAVVDAAAELAPQSDDRSEYRRALTVEATFQYLRNANAAAPASGGSSSSGLSAAF